MEEGFQYVVERQQPARIFFGSAIERNTNPIGDGLSSFQKRYAHETFSRLSPQSYDFQHLTSGIDRLSNKVRSRRGLSGLANRAPRFSYKMKNRVPSPTRYDSEPFWRKFEQCREPFNKCMPRKFRKRMEVPGVGTYNISSKRCRRTKLEYNFGRPAMIPAVEVKCSPVLTDICNRCRSICTNDYWRKNDFLLCHICMEEEKFLPEDFTYDQLKQFTKQRNCTFKHSHEGTSSAVSLLPENTIRKMERLENYLNLYINSF